MKVLFVSAGNYAGQPKEVVFNQGKALGKEGIILDFFCVRGGGLRGYIASLPLLRNRIKEFKPDIIHAHYSLCGFLSCFAGSRPLIVSLMGSELHHKSILRAFSRIFARYFWDFTIVKSQEMDECLAVDKAAIIPNGVDLASFYEFPKGEAIAKTVLDKGKINILFAADPSRPEKNFSLAQASVKLLDGTMTHLASLVNIPNQDMRWYYNAADVLLLTSDWEGSPNVVKEAMSCGCPIVSTDVGDVRTILGSVKGTYIANKRPEDIAVKLEEAMRFASKEGRTKGRERIRELRLDTESVSREIISLYNAVLKKAYKKTSLS